MPPIAMFLKKLMAPVHKACIELSANAKRLIIIHDIIMREHIRNVHVTDPKCGVLCLLYWIGFLPILAHTKDNKQWWAIGPFHMLLLESHNSSNRTRHECLEFLDKKDVNSVIFISFGRTTTFSQEQVNEIALGLE
ncbi:hypothetical protein P3S67_008563 [Capsicum chacoense]